jgi:hypothetical protein
MRPPDGALLRPGAGTRRRLGLVPLVLTSIAHITCREAPVCCRVTAIAAFVDYEVSVMYGAAEVILAPVANNFGWVLLRFATDHARADPEPAVERSPAAMTNVIKKVFLGFVRWQMLQFLHRVALNKPEALNHRGGSRKAPMAYDATAASGALRAGAVDVFACLKVRFGALRALLQARCVEPVAAVQR